MPTPIVIDLSHHNTIPKDLSGARDAGIVGVIHKATEGTRSVDPKVRARYSLAQDAGLLWGIYHFLRPGYIRQQVDHFLNSAIWSSDSVLVCDFEVEGIPLESVLLFLEEVEKASSQKPVLYGGSVLKQLGGAKALPELADYRLWLAQYGPRAVLPKGYDRYWLWQYTEKGKVDGIDGSVDLNTYAGSAEDLKQNWVVKTISDPVVHRDPPAPDPTSDPVVDKPDKPPPEPQVVVKEQASAWSKVWTGVCAFFSAIWTTITGWYATDFAKPLIDKARDNAASNVTVELLPQIALLLGTIIVIGGVGLLFLWLGVWIWNHEKQRVALLNAQKLEIASSQKKATVEFTTDPAKATASVQTGGNDVTGQSN